MKASNFSTESERLVAVFEFGRATRLDGVNRLSDAIARLVEVGYTEAQAKEAAKAFAEKYFRSGAA